MATHVAAKTIQIPTAGMKVAEFDWTADSGSYSEASITKKVTFPNKILTRDEKRQVQTAIQAFEIEARHNNGKSEYAFGAAKVDAKVTDVEDGKTVTVKITAQLRPKNPDPDGRTFQFRVKGRVLVTALLDTTFAVP
ncbi:MULTISPECIES: hypothetical protein [unclassified Streptomyces]|uniref:hypothetical protein n=1 Tax=unclassified Streptomyces TaxID=2593676 RepID=UPI0003647593|nr:MULTISPECIES: hypothetical protein [unclassified Streptomyces]MYT27587.1 hypothetical protein [Streptomyces sp. SID8354]